MTCKIIQTGSKGNAVLLDGEILIDCGVAFNRIEPLYTKISIVLLTHIHGDHFNGGTIAKLARMRPMLRIFAAPWLIRPLLEAGVKPEQIVKVPPGFMAVFGKWSFRPIAIQHDVPNVGWLIINNESQQRAFYATDTGSLDDLAMVGLDLYMIEANHEEAEIFRRIQEKIAAGQFCYEARAVNNHLSAEQAERWLTRNATPGVSQVVYLHQHAAGA